MKTAQRVLATALDLFNQHGETSVTSVEIANEMDTDRMVPRLKCEKKSGSHYLTFFYYLIKWKIVIASASAITSGNLFVCHTMRLPFLLL